MASSSSSSSARFIDAALRATGERALSYTDRNLKWVIRQHLLALLGDFPTLAPRSDTFTDDDGAASHLLQAHGFLPISSATPHVLVTIWLHRSYPHHAPIVYVFPTDARLLPHDHPFFDPSGAVASPYLHRWRYPSSDLSHLARNLVNIFRLRHPYHFDTTPPPPAADALWPPGSRRPTAYTLASTATRSNSRLGSGRRSSASGACNSRCVTEPKLSSPACETSRRSGCTWRGLWRRRRRMRTCCRLGCRCTAVSRRCRMTRKRWRQWVRGNDAWRRAKPRRVPSTTWCARLTKRWRRVCWSPELTSSR
ncbi:unnamed protein product [Musa textilis]